MDFPQRTPIDRDAGLYQMLPAGDRCEAERASFREKTIKFLLGGRRREPIPAHLGFIEPPQPGRIGICCSGGGIRSASYNLGALQALASDRELEKADYLAAVSGGAYIAAAMSMVAKTGDENSDDSDPSLVTPEAPPFHRTSPEEQYLRNRSAYLAPDFSDKLALLYRVCLGLFFHLFFLSLVLAPLGFLLGLVYRQEFPFLVTRRSTGGWTCAVETVNCDFAAGPVGSAKIIGLVCLCAAGLLGIVSLIIRFKKERYRAHVQSASLRLLVVAAFISLIFVWLPGLLAALRNLADTSSYSGVTSTQHVALGTVGGTSLATVLLGILLQLRSRVAEPATALENLVGIRRILTKTTSRVRLVIVYVAGAVAGPLLLLAIVVYAALLTVRASSTQLALYAAIAVVALVGFGLIYLTADLTTWSLHPFYRRRLASVFALKRVKGWNGPEARARKYNKQPPLSTTAVTWRSGWPTLIVCAAANISNPGATPPGRSVTSFTFSATSLGGPLIGGVKTVDFERTINPKRRQDVTLMAAVAMSGAALAPSMGKLTRRPLTFLLALANIRLGVWVPNPRYTHNWMRRQDRHPRAYVPRPRPSWLLRELLGLNNVNAKFVYVTDGGHYENLGLVELLRRGCTKIYCFDASGGPPGAFGQLGDAVALARSELGVDIRIDPSDLVPLVDDPRQHAKSDCVKGEIHFPAPGQAQGEIVYARTVITKDAPWDVHAYHQGDARFPNNPTADQLYTDQKFEAYRALGELAGRNSVRLMYKVADLLLARDGAGAGTDGVHGLPDGAPADGGEPVRLSVPRQGANR